MIRYVRSDLQTFFYSVSNIKWQSEKFIRKLYILRELKVCLHDTARVRLRECH